MASKRYIPGPDGIARIPLAPGKRRFRTPEISDLNPPEVIAGRRLMTLMRYMGELPELGHYYNALLNELKRQGLGKRKLRGGGINLYFPELVESLKPKG